MNVNFWIFLWEDRENKRIFVESLEYFYVVKLFCGVRFNLLIYSLVLLKHIF